MDGPRDPVPTFDPATAVHGWTDCALPIVGSIPDDPKACDAPDGGCGRTWRQTEAGWRCIEEGMVRVETRAS